MHQALVERADLIESRAAAVLDQAVLAGEPWTQTLGAAPRGSAAAAWHQSGCTVAAYRDRYDITGAKPLGAAPETTAQRLDADRAFVALRAVQRLAEYRHAFDARTRIPSESLHLPADIRF
ncbi:hypothetical protein [Cryobacterium sp. Y11]|uniref:hypothetical protein n=1 Tax=Cryobacterium sp. Y11 TaxID=2045016 RepID=UPI000CE4F511|nr:hypothetical protein [Cryobacterium sp. Y11]